LKDVYITSKSKKKSGKFSLAASLNSTLLQRVNDQLTIISRHFAKWFTEQWTVVTGHVATPTRHNSNVLLALSGITNNAAVVAETGAAGMRDMGKVMAAVKTQLAGKADMGEVSAAVKAALNR
jgi:hypothetical protein